MLGRRTSAALLGLAIGAIGVAVGIVPFTLRVEESAGLHWLFALRGPRQPPGNVHVVRIDRPSAEALGVPADPARWPRSLHAKLVENLAAAGARVIVLDIFFGEPGLHDDDAAFAAALRAAGNVVLTMRLERRYVPLGRAGAGNRALEAVRVELAPPIEVLSASAFATAPFLLPAWPMKVSQFWAFNEEAGEYPTLPMVALQAYAAGLRDELTGAVRTAGIPDRGVAAVEARTLTDFMQALRELCLAEPARVEALAQAIDAGPAVFLPEAPALRLAGLLRLYAGPSSYYLNYYGPPLSVPTIPYHEAVSGEPLRTVEGRPLDLRDSIVFVGFAARRQADQKDSFFSVFSEESGLNLSGVEIAATATANLLEGRPLRPLGPLPALAVLFAWGAYLGFVCRALPGAVGVAAGIASASLYLVFAVGLFSAADLWMPVMVPVFLQTTLATVGALVLQFREARRQRARISAALGRYVPPRLVERLVDESRASAAAVEIVHGTCMATDAAQYTLMAETLAPDELTRLMNAYYELLFTEVERFGGQVSDVVGDAMMAIWASARPEATVQRNACDAALHLAAELQARALAGDRAALPTRIGLHSGEIRLGEIGARQHFEYRAVGDIVNTATRIESLNKQLGTRILVSAEALAGVGGLATREVGTFLLAGKTVPVVVHELLGQAEQPLGTAARNVQLFSAALAEFRAGRWGEARQLFARYLERVADDGPARYYLRLCEDYLATGPVSFTGGAVRIQAK